MAGSISQRQPHQCMSGRQEEVVTKLRRSRREQQEAAKWVNQRRSVFDLSRFLRSAAEGDGEEFNSLRGGGETEADMFAADHVLHFSP